MYTILVGENHSLITTNKERIMQRSQGVNSLCLLIKPEINGLDINSCTVLLEYCTPKSREYDNRILEVNGLYNDEYLQYIVPFDLPLTTEWGDLEVQLSFIYVDLDIDGNPVQKVKKTEKAVIKITPNTAWSDMMPDSRFTAVDQRIIKLDAQIKALLDSDNVCNSLEDGVPVVDFSSINSPSIDSGDNDDDNVIEF